MSGFSLKFSPKTISIPPLLKDFYNVFEKAGFKAYLVGGAVRDIFLKKQAHDWDVATNATPQDVMKIFKFVVPTGFEHGTVTVHFKNQEIEVTTFRTEAGYSDGRHPDSVNYAATIEEDLARRDFTMNAIAVNLADGKIVDPYKGREDIKAKIIRTVGKAYDRFMEDGLRPVRALRFASQLDFQIEKETFAAISNPDVQKKVDSISRERFRDEFVKMMKADLPSVGLKMMEKTGILNIFIPEFTACRGCNQSDDRGYHIFDVMDHNIYACDGAPKEKPLIRIAALFHDIGKPQSKSVTTENGLTVFHFFQHEKYSEKITREVMTRLKFSNAEIDHVCHLVLNHMFNYESTWTSAAVRRFLVKVGRENVEDLIDLRLADMYGKYNQPVRIHDSKACDLLIELQDRIEKVQEAKAALSLKDLKVNGKDLMAQGIPAGKVLGAILQELFDCVLEDPSLNDREKLLEIAKKKWENAGAL